MDDLQKPQGVFKKFVSKVSIQTVVKSGSDEEVEPLSISRVRDEWPLPRSVDFRDPKNWPAWKKDLAFVSVLVSTAVVGILKTLFVTTNSVIATQYNVSYTAAAALTGVPFMIAALSSLGSAILSQAAGKRAIHIGATLLMLIGSVWNMRIMDSYTQFMFSRIFQGVGWGAFEGIAIISVRDIFSPHELPLCFNMLSITSALFTWGSPIIGGFLSQSTYTFHAELLVVNIIQAFSVFFALFFFPETSYKASSTAGTNSPSFIRSYASSLHPLPYTATFIRTALQPIRALATPSTILTLTLAGPLTASAFGLANSLSLLFTSNPIFLLPTHLGFFFIPPVSLSIILGIIITAITLLSHSPLSFYKIVSPGTVIGLVGLLSFGLYTSMNFLTQAQNISQVSGGIAARDAGVGDLSLPVVALLLGFLVAGVSVIGAALQLHGSISSRYGDVGSTMGDNGDVHIERACRIWIDVLSGIFIVAIPAFAISQEDMGAATWVKTLSIVIAVVQIFACVVVGAVSWLHGSRVKAWDGKILGLNDTTEGRRSKGFSSA